MQKGKLKAGFIGSSESVAKTISGKTTGFKLFGCLIVNSNRVKKCLSVRNVNLVKARP